MEAAMDFQGRRILVLGVANEKSIAWGVVQDLKNRGAELALTYANEAIERRVRPLAESIGCEHVFPCDVQSDEQIGEMFKSIKERWQNIDGIVHSLAFASQDDLKARFSDTSREGFRLALDVSAYSLIAICRGARELFSPDASVVTMTYIGSERVVQNYNIMGVAKAALEANVRYLAADLGLQGVRVNAVSAGPVRTLAASGIPQFRELLAQFAERAPLKRNVTVPNVAAVTNFLLSPASAGVTGEITFVDCGFNIMGL